MKNSLQQREQIIQQHPTINGSLVMCILSSFVDSHYTAQHNFEFCCECRNPDNCSMKRGAPGMSELVEQRKRVADALAYRKQYEKLYVRLHLRVSTTTRATPEKSTTVTLSKNNNNNNNNKNEKEGKQQTERLAEEGKLSFQQAQDHIAQINYVLEDPLEMRAENCFERIFFLGPTTTTITSYTGNYDRVNMTMLVRFQMTKQRVKQELKQYDRTFARHHDGRRPTKAEKENIRYLYDRYNLVKRKIQELEGSLNLINAGLAVTEENKAASTTNETEALISHIGTLAFPKGKDDRMGDDDNKHLDSNDGGGDCCDGIDASDEGSWCLV